MLKGGTRLGRYQIVEPLGAGGMGEVYRARDERLERDVALKVLPSGALADEAARKRFRREALALAKLNHPHIGTVHEFDTQDGMDFLVMEYIAGATLQQRLQRGPLPEKEIASLGVQIAEALEEAHEHGVVHRDLKPANVMVTEKGRVKVLDFGLAKLLLPEGDTTLTQNLGETQPFAGTLPYMAPEQLRGAPVDARTDIWALGAVLYEMATGQRPFPERTAAALAGDILHRPVAAPRTANPALSVELERIILRCLQKEPENRYPSAKETLANLRGLGAPATTSAKSRPPRARRYAWFYGGAGVALTLALAAANFGGWRTRLFGPRADAGIESLAVLPLANLSGDAQQDYFADGMTDELITDLSQVRGLRVISRTSVMQYKKTTKTLPQIAKELNVEGVVEGAVQRDGNRVRITAQLIEAASDKHLWSGQYERELSGVMALQDEVARAVAGDIKGKLSPEDFAGSRSVQTVVPEAYDAYLRARFILGSTSVASEDAEATKEGVTMAERAVQLDPTFAMGQALLAHAYIDLFFNYDPNKEYEQKAYVAIQKALSLDPNLADAYQARGDLAWTLANHFPHEQAARDYHQALRLNPNLSSAHAVLGILYLHVGILDKAGDELNAAIRLDPNSELAQYRIQRLYLFQQKYQEALSEAERHPEFVQWQHALALFYVGRKPEARELIEKLIRERQGASEDNSSTYAILLASAGEKQKAEQQIKIAIKAGKGKSHFHHAEYNIASAYALMGDHSAALDWLEKTAEDGMPCYPLFANDPNLNNLRSDPQFVTFLAGVKSQWEHLKEVL